jgi:hypothetical protein
LREGTAEGGLFLIPLPTGRAARSLLSLTPLFFFPPFSAQSGNRLAVIPSRRYGCSHLVATHAKSAVAFASAHPDAAAPPGGGDLAGHHAVRYLSLPDAAFIRFLTGHTAPVTSLALHPANDTLLSASRDDSVRLWDLRSPVCSGRMAVPGAPTVAADRQGLVFAVGVAGGVIKLFDSRQYDAGPFSIITVGGGGRRRRGGVGGGRAPARAAAAREHPRRRGPAPARSGRLFGPRFLALRRPPGRRGRVRRLVPGRVRRQHAQPHQHVRRGRRRWGRRRRGRGGRGRRPPPTHTRDRPAGRPGRLLAR